MATAAPKFVAFDRRDRNFFLGFVIVAWIGVVLGFAPPSWARFHGKADYPAPLILQLHAGLYLLWMALLAVQVGLVRWQNVGMHRRLGPVALAMIPLMIVTGFFAEVYSQRFYLTHPPNSQQFFIIPIFYVVAFGALAALAVARRSDPAAHKRLIYLATTIIVGAAWTRTIGPSLTAAFGDGFWGMIVNTFASTNAFLLAIALFDRVTRGRLHPVLLTMIPALIVSEFAVSWIYHNPGWLVVARAIAGALPGPPLPA